MIGRLYSGWPDFDILNLIFALRAQKIAQKSPKVFFLVSVTIVDAKKVPLYYKNQRNELLTPYRYYAWQLCKVTSKWRGQWPQIYPSLGIDSFAKICRISLQVCRLFYWSVFKITMKENCWFLPLQLSIYSIFYHCYFK